MIVDLDSAQAQIAQHYMTHKGIRPKPHAVDKLDDQPCWYFYYTLPQGELELEVAYDEDVRVLRSVYRNNRSYASIKHRHSNVLTESTWTLIEVWL